jgi:hypothetical protein
MEHKFTIVVIAAVLTSLLLAGTILAPIQSYAAGGRGGFPNTSTLKQAVRDGITVSQEHRDQHMNQENLCYRDNTCRQSDVGQNTLGNDNSITGFADQSDNIQQSAAPTTANQTIPSPTPTPIPTTATLTVIKIVSGRTTATPSNFTMHVTGNNPTPADFAGSSAGIVVTIGSGPFNVIETGPTSSFNTTITGDCSGTIAAGQHLACVINNTVKTCEECFTSLLTTAQITALLAQSTSLPEFCATLARTGNLESGFVNLLTSSTVGVSLTTANELVACLKAAGIVFI